MKKISNVLIKSVKWVFPDIYDVLYSKRNQEKEKEKTKHTEGEKEREKERERERESTFFY